MFAPPPPFDIPPSNNPGSFSGVGEGVFEAGKFVPESTVRKRGREISDISALQEGEILVQEKEGKTLWPVVSEWTEGERYHAIPKSVLR